MGACDLIQGYSLVQGYNLADVKSLPTCLKCLIDVASGFDLCFGWHIITADEQESGIHKHKLPDRNLQHWGIRCIVAKVAMEPPCAKTFRIGLDIRSESHFDYVMNSIESQHPDSFRQVCTGLQNLIAPARDAISLSASARQAAITRATARSASCTAQAPTAPAPLALEPSFPWE
jgi:hypothetical protein